MSLRNNWNEAKHLFNRFTCIITLQLTYSKGRLGTITNAISLSFLYIFNCSSSAAALLPSDRRSCIMQEERAAHQGCRLKHGRQGGGDTAERTDGGRWRRWWLGGSRVKHRQGEGDGKKMEMKESLWL